VVVKYTWIAIVVNAPYPLGIDVAIADAGKQQHSNNTIEVDSFIDKRMWSADNLSQISAPRSDAMHARDDGEVRKLSPGGSPRRQAAAPISSLNEAWLHALDKCAMP
jgi:hypothetical protein